MRRRTCVDGASECVASENCGDFYFYCGTTLSERLSEGDREGERERKRWWGCREDASQITFSTLALGNIGRLDVEINVVD